MIKFARKYAGWAPNMTVKFPATLAGLEAMEECIAEGITITATVNFTVPQVIQVAEAYRRGISKAQKSGRKPGRCFAVIMIGRIDDYLRDVASDNNAPVRESDINYAGIAITKRLYSIFRDRGYEAKLLVAALRGTHHMVELCGGDIVMSIHPNYQKELLKPDVPRELRITDEVPQDVIERLLTVPEFARAYEPDGMKPEEFISFGLTQRTLTQFSISGWSAISSIVL
jgi:transaldolase